MNRVLIAIDYDPTAQKVAETAYSLFSKTDTEITLLHVVSNPLYYSSGAYDPFMGFGGYANVDMSEPGMVEDLKTKSLSFLDSCRLHLGDNNISIVVKEGDVAECIEDTALELKASVIVMGSHSRRWLENIMMGSITEKVLHHSHIPLLVIPTKQGQ